jgi:hypothetical protein
MASFSAPNATKRQLRRATSLLDRLGYVPVADSNGHIGAVGLFRQHLRELDPVEHVIEGGTKSA